MNYIVELADISDIDSILELHLERMRWFKENNINNGADILKIILNQSL